MTQDFRSGFGKWLGLLTLIALFVVQGLAQTTTSGDLNGTITDPSGAVVSGAKVALTSLETGVTQTTVTTASGVYRFPLLKPGDYRLSVSQTGFRSLSQNVTVGVGQALTNNLSLELGQAAETVEVTAAVPLIQTEDANLSTTFSNTQVENLPNGGNDLTQVAQTAPGVLMNSSSGGGYGNFTAFGLPATSNLFTVNGNDEMDPYLNLNNSGATNLLLGSGEVDEVAVVANGYTGQYGRMAGAQINYVTKSGSNQFHGSAKYWWNGSSLNANDWFNNHTDPKTPLPFENNNQYQAQIGGPIVKDKLFFFVGTEGLRYVLGTSNQVFIPSTGFASAVEANLADPNGGALPNSVPFYTNLFNVMQGAPGINRAVPVTAAQDSLGGCGDFAGQSFPGSPNTIWGPVESGQTPCAVTFRSNVGQLSTEWLMYAKVDWIHSNSDKWSLRFKTDHGLQPTFTDAINPLFNATSNQPQYEGQLSNTHVFSANVINQFILSGSWYSAFFKNPTASQATALFPYAIYDFDSPFGTPSNAVMIGGENNVFPQGRNVTQYQIVDDVTWTRGNHSLKFGGNFRRNDITDGTFGVRTIPRARIFSTTDFAYGFIDQFSQRFPEHLTEPMALYSFGLYAQDEWRATDKLKLTLTLRADRNSNAVCQTDCFSRLATQYSKLNYDPTTPYNQLIKTNLHQAFQDLQAINFEPRIGFAYNIHQNTVIRGGVGMFTDLYPATLVDNFASQAPRNTQFTLAGNLSPAEPDGVANLVLGCDSAFNTVFTNGGTYADFKATAPHGCNAPDYHDITNNVRNPTYVEWNLQVQQGIGRRSAISLNYVGNHGYDEFIYNDLLNAYDPSGTSSLPISQQLIQLRNFQGLSNAATSNYNGLTASFTQQALYGFQFSVNYTWSKSLDAISNGGILPYSFNDTLSSAINPFNLKAQDYGPSDYDVRHNFTANYVWQVPTHFTGAMDKLLGGWTLSGTFFARSGYPFTMQDTGTGFPLGTAFAVGYSPLPTFVGSSVNCGKSAANTACFNIAQFPDAGNEVGLAPRSGTLSVDRATSTLISQC